MTNPLFERGGKHGQRSERRLAKTLKAHRSLASGALPGQKGDMRKGRFLSEAKATIHASASIKLAWLTKITEEATQIGCAPLLLLSFVNGSGEPRVNGDWVLMPMSTFNELNADGS